MVIFNENGSTLNITFKTPLNLNHSFFTSALPLPYKGDYCCFQTRLTWLVNMAAPFWMEKVIESS